MQAVKLSRLPIRIALKQRLAAKSSSASPKLPCRHCRGIILSKRPHNAIERFGEHIHDHNRAINEYKPRLVITMNWTSKLSVLKELNMFDENFTRCEDVDLSYRILQAGYRFAFKPGHSHKNKPPSPVFSEKASCMACMPCKRSTGFPGELGHRKLNGGSYSAIVSCLFHYVVGKDSDFWRTAILLFLDSGKKLESLSAQSAFVISICDQRITGINVETKTG